MRCTLSCWDGMVGEGCKDYKCTRDLATTKKVCDDAQVNQLLQPGSNSRAQ